jgi:hypothetical protein
LHSYNSHGAFDGGNSMLAPRRHLVLLAALAALVLPGKAGAADVALEFSGGSDTARAEVIAALDASAFDWSLIGRPVTVQIFECGCAGSRPGVVVLDETMLASSPYGRAYTWGIVQHEFAHQVWWYALDDERRSELQALLGGRDLCYEQPGLPHDAHACELFASTMTWAYWPVAGNPMQAEKVMGARSFRRLLSRLLAIEARLRVAARRFVG